MLLYIMAIQNDNDRNTVERLYRENYRWMLYIAKQILKDQNKAEDAVSQTFVKIIDKLQKFSFENCNKTRGLIGILVKDILFQSMNAICLVIRMISLLINSCLKKIINQCCLLYLA